MAMFITKHHVFNLILWVVILLFMGIKSLQHTVAVHNQGVSVAIQEYQMQAQARLGYIEQHMGAGNDPMTRQVLDLLGQIKTQTNPYIAIELNHALTQLLYAHLNDLPFTPQILAQFKQLQDAIKQEQLVFLSHAQSYNRLIARFPYVLVAKEASPVPMNVTASITGVIVER